MLAGIQDILLITTPRDAIAFQHLLGDGRKFGINLQYAEQPSPDGIAQAFVIGKSFIGENAVSLILGDNIFYSQGMRELLTGVSARKENATVFGYYVKNPEDYGVVEFNSQGKVISLEEKPNKPKSNFAITGLYFYDNQVIEMAESLSPSKRGELEITEINSLYLQQERLNVELFSRGTAWLDTGQHTHLLDASNFVRIVEERQGLKIACPEEVAYNMGFISADDLRKLGERLSTNDYGQYLLKILEIKPLT